MSPEPDRDPVTDPLLRKALQPALQSDSDGCVDAETLAAWADGNLPADQAADVEAHLADCLRCQAVLDAFEMTDESAAPAAAPASVIPFRPRSPVRWLLPLAASVAATLVLWTAVRNRTPAPLAEPQQTVALSYPSDLARADAKAEAPPAPPPVLAEKQFASPRKEKAVAANAPKVSAAPAPAAFVSPAPVAAPTPSAVPPAQAGAAAASPPSVTQAAANSAATRDVTSARTEPEPFRADSANWALAKVVAEFSPPAAPAPGFGRSFASGGRGGAGGGGRAAALPADRATPHVRWRVLASGLVLKSTNDGEWTVVPITPAGFILNGHAPSPTVCWLVGRSGIVMLSTDGTKFTRVLFPDLSDLRSITAVDAHQATVTTTDGRVFTTENAGETWQLKY